MLPNASLSEGNQIIDLGKFQHNCGMASETHILTFLPE
jgi:hypothetical protein